MSIQDTYKVDNTISLRPDPSYPATLVEDKPARPSNELMAYIIDNTGGATSPYAFTQTPTTITKGQLPTAPAGTTRVTMFVDNVAYFPLVAPCPAVSCTNGNPIVNAIPDPGTSAYTEAVARKLERDVNIATAVLGVGGAIIRGGSAVGELAGVATAVTRAAPAAEVAARANSAAAESGAAFPIGSRYGQMNQPTSPSYQPVRNQAGTVGETNYSGHAFDRMQNRGIMPSVVNDTISNGIASPSRGGTTVYFSLANNVSVVTNSQGKIITVTYGGK